MKSNHLRIELDDLKVGLDDLKVQVQPWMPIDDTIYARRRVKVFEFNPDFLLGLTSGAREPQKYRAWPQTWDGPEEILHTSLPKVEWGQCMWTVTVPWCHFGVCTRHKGETQIIELGDSSTNEPVLVSVPDPALCYRATAFVCFRGRKKAFVSLIA